MRARIRRRHLPHDLKGAIGTAIVRKNDLQRRPCLRERAFDRLADEMFLIVAEHEHADERSLRRALVRSLFEVFHRVPPGQIMDVEQTSIAGKAHRRINLRMPSAFLGWKATPGPQRPIVFGKTTA